MYRTHTCGELRNTNLSQQVTLSGWVQKVRNLGAMTFIDIRDRYGITQLVVDEHSPAELKETADKLGREFVIQATGKVVERDVYKRQVSHRPTPAGGNRPPTAAQISHGREAPSANPFRDEARTVR